MEIKITIDDKWGIRNGKSAKMSLKEVLEMSTKQNVIGRSCNCGTDTETPMFCKAKGVRIG